MKISNYLMIGAAGLMTLAGVSCTDLSSIEKDLDSLESRVTALETQIKTLNENVIALQELRNATTIKSATHNTTENTWTVELSDGTILTLNDGVIGEGKTPALSINAEGYWTVDYKDGKGYVPVKDAAGNPVKALGTDGKTPVFGVDANGYWTVDYGTGATQVKDASGNPVKASASDAADSFFEDVKLSADGKTLEIKLKGDTKYYTLPIVSDFWFNILDNEAAATGLYTFDRGQTKVFSVDQSGVASAVIVAKPSDSWAVVLEGTTLTVTAPAASTKAVAADSRTDIAILAVSEKGFTTTAKIKVALNDAPIEVHPAASVSFTGATETILSFSVTATDFSGCKYVIKSDGTVPTAEEISTGGTAIAFETGAATASFTVAGLTGETTYKVFVLPFNGDVLGELVSVEGTTTEKTYTSLYAKWMDGKDIVIDGVAYNKATWTGNNAVLVNSDATAKIGTNGIYFIDPSITAYIGASMTFSNLILIGDSPIKQSNFVLESYYLNLKTTDAATDKFIFYNICFNATARPNYSITINNNTHFEYAAFIDCDIKLAIQNNPFIYKGGKPEQIGSIKKTIFKNCNIHIGGTGAQRNLMSAGTTEQAYGTVNIENCIFYTDGAVTNFKIFAGGSTSFEKVTIKNNTFVNSLTDGSFMNTKSIGTVDIHNNIFYGTPTKNSYIISCSTYPSGNNLKDNIGYAQVASDNKTYKWLAVNGLSANWFEGVEEIQQLTENPFEGGTFNLAEGKFIPNANYSGYGAKR